MKSHESAENYLETILMLSHSGQPIRSVDIAKELNYSRPSVSIAMKNLRADGYITIDESSYIKLTESGREIAQRMYDRHMLISDWLIFLGVDRETAVNDACRMEHTMSEQSFTAIQKHIENWKRSIYNQKPEK
ncbi:MAG: metal-dependent transcriptional regulator [Chitinispirillales bacterium]|nr:metal-dependent transcriptional regulator [Chitinispirillales bacterium]